MHFPFIVLSYGKFTRTKKLFSYEVEGVHTLPIFFDAAAAMKFANVTNTMLKGRGARKLQTCVCTSPRAALEMFQVIVIYCKDLMRIVIDPAPPTSGEEIEPSTLRLIPNYRDIDEVIEDLQNLQDASKGTNEPSSS